MQQAIPAATLILWRDGPPPEILMVERAATMAFAAGAMVFPGGRVDPGDRDLAADAADPEDAAARIAAIRETVEEAGIAVGIVPAPDSATLAHWRAALAAGGGFAALLDGGGHHLDLTRLTPFARWVPQTRETRNFDTRFFLARAPADAAAIADGGESVHAMWTTPQAVIEEAIAGRRRIIFPTRRNLERLAAHADFASAATDAATRPVTPITPWIEERDGERGLCIPADRGYPVTFESLATASRG